MPSLISSKLPNKISVVNGDSYGNISLFLLEKEITLAKILKKAGYITVFYSANPALFYTNFSKDFDFQFYTSGEGVEDDMLITRKATNYLEQNKEKNFFMWVHYISPHAPYRPDYPFNESFVFDNFFDEYTNIVIDINHDSRPQEIDPDYLIAQYDGEIKFADNEFAKLISKLDEMNLMKNTIVIVSSDHGESMTEHQNYFEHNVLYDDNLKVPLIIFDPAKQKRKIISEQFQGIDFVPTVLSLLDIDSPKSFEGNSVFERRNKSELAISMENENYISYRTNEWKLIITGNERELFDLKADPLEKNNLISDYLHLNISSGFREKIEDNSSSGEVEQELINPDEELIRRLKSLGYLN